MGKTARTLCGSILVGTATALVVSGGLHCARHNATSGDGLQQSACSGPAATVVTAGVQTFAVADGRIALTRPSDSAHDNSHTIFLRDVATSRELSITTSAEIVRVMTMDARVVVYESNQHDFHVVSLPAAGLVDAGSLDGGDLGTVDRELGAYSPTNALLYGGQIYFDGTSGIVRAPESGDGVADHLSDVTGDFNGFDVEGDSLYVLGGGAVFLVSLTNRTTRVSATLSNDAGVPMAASVFEGAVYWGEADPNGRDAIVRSMLVDGEQLSTVGRSLPRSCNSSDCSRDGVWVTLIFRALGHVYWIEETVSASAQGDGGGYSYAAVLRSNAPGCGTLDSVTLRRQEDGPSQLGSEGGALYWLHDDRLMRMAQ